MMMEVHRFPAKENVTNFGTKNYTTSLDLVNQNRITHMFFLNADNKFQIWSVNVESLKLIFNPVLESTVKAKNLSF